jgi:hypothetical protein
VILTIYRGLLPVHSQQNPGFVRGRRTRGSEPKRQGNALGVRPGFGEQTLSQFAGGLDVSGIVHEDQRLERGVGSLAAHGAGLAVRRIETRESGRRARAFPESIHRAPIQVRAVALGVRLGGPILAILARGQFLPQAGGVVGRGAVSANRLV